MPVLRFCGKRRPGLSDGGRGLCSAGSDEQQEYLSPGQNRRGGRRSPGGWHGTGNGGPDGGTGKTGGSLAGLGGKPFSTWAGPWGRKACLPGNHPGDSGTPADWFSNATLHAFFRSGYTITAQSDRMGYRLSGTPLPYKDSSLEMISEPVTFGSIQVPADGNPII